MLGKGIRTLSEIHKNRTFNLSQQGNSSHSEDVTVVLITSRNIPFWQHTVVTSLSAAVTLMHTYNISNTSSYTEAVMIMWA